MRSSMEQRVLLVAAIAPLECARPRADYMAFVPVGRDLDLYLREPRAVLAAVILDELDRALA
jgi:hypothetical protein